VPTGPFGWGIKPMEPLVEEVAQEGSDRHHPASGDMNDPSLSEEMMKHIGMTFTFGQ